ILCAEISWLRVGIAQCNERAEQPITPRLEAENVEDRERGRTECSRCSVSIGNVRDSLNRQRKIRALAKTSYPSGTGSTRSSTDGPLSSDGPSVRPSFAASWAKQLRPVCSQFPTSPITLDIVKAARY